MLAQEGDWGERAARAYRERLESRGGRVLAEARYKPGTVDYSKTLKSLLLLDASQARHRALAAIGLRSDFEPQPRSDADTLFIAARAREARLLWPQLRYYRAGRLAAYALAAAGDAGSSDLTGLRLCDAPWRLEQSGPMADLRGELAAANPRAADAQRLFALGFDAYALAARIGSGSLRPGEEIAGLTGRLVLEADGAVRRSVDCAAAIPARPADDDSAPPSAEAVPPEATP